ncbi:acid protease [Saccharata proteae CBS 121410]|uniref:Acid protease n=1 Tax=Saccharata proteae CBS 121410 TaxID=1314787 RepID=A0A9P4LVD5_9PEZI|nr:acid protease [Saccharata proteae CBS 121410]
MSLSGVILSLSLASAGLAAPAPKPASASSGQVKVPIGSRSLTLSNGDVNGPAVLANLDRVLKKYGNAGLTLPRGESTSILGKRDGSTESLLDQWEEGGEDLLYYGDFTIRDMDFTCDFDTGSSDLFVPGPDCTTDAGCLAGTKYDDEGTYRGNSTSVTYGSGAIEGDNYLDNVTIAGITAVNQNVISLNTAEGFNTSISNSLCGLGFNNIAESNSPTFFSTMVTQGSVDADEFSFFFGRGEDGNGNCSELVLGGRDTTKIDGDLTTVPVSEEGYWQTDLGGVSIGGKTVDDGSTSQAIIDTGTTVIISPVDVASDIAKALNGYTLTIDGESLIVYPCNSKKAVEITLGGTSFTVSSEDMNLGQITPSFGDLVGASIKSTDAKGYCLAGIIGADLLSTGSYYILGDTFLKNVYSIFSYSADDGSPAVLFADVASGVTC